MALVFHRGLAVPLWAIAFFAVVLAAPPRPVPPVTVLLGMAVLALTMMAMLQWRRSRALVHVAPVTRPDRAHAGIIMTTVSARQRGWTVDRAPSAPAPDDALDLVRMDDDGGWQMAREAAVPALIPGAREPGMLTTFAAPPASGRIPEEPSTMDATTIAERQREGGGAPNQRRPQGDEPRWNLAHALHQFLTATRALYTRRFRPHHV